MSDKTNKHQTEGEEFYLRVAVVADAAGLADRDITTGIFYRSWTKNPDYTIVIGGDICIVDGESIDDAISKLCGALLAKGYKLPHINF